MVDVRQIAIRVILSAARWTGAATVARPFLSGSGAILMLHHVTQRNWSPLGLSSGLTITPQFLDRLLADLRRRGRAIVPMDEIPDVLRAGRGHQVVAITADDAYLDNLAEALPVFEAYDAPFTLYVAPGLISGETLPWWEVVEEIALRRSELRIPARGGIAETGEVLLACRTPAEKRAAAWRLTEWLTREVAEHHQQAVLRALGGEAGETRRFMNWDELRGLARHPLATLGAHTVHHVNVKRLDEKEALREMVDSAALIERETGFRPRHFAFPYGHKAAAGAREVALARRAGFATAVTTRHGVLASGHVDHLHALPRISVNGNFQNVADVHTLMSGLTTMLSGGRRLVTV